MKTKIFFLTLCLAALSYSHAATPPVPAFTKCTTDFIPNYRTNIAVGDYNNDGLLDIFYIGENSAGGARTTCLYKNNGDGTFTQQDINIPEMTMTSAAWIDYDNDGNLDLIVCGTTSSDVSSAAAVGSGALTKLYRNTGATGGYTFEEVTTAQFTQTVNEGNDYPFDYVTVGDYDNDGLPDILITGVDNTKTGTLGYRRVDLYKNNGDGTFTVQGNVLDGIGGFTNADGGTVRFADMNNDSYLDIIATGYSTSGTFYLYMNNADGTFTDYTPGNIPGAYQGGAIAADFDNDGNLDLAVNGINYVAGSWPRYTTLGFNTGAGDGSVTIANNTGLEAFSGGRYTSGDLNNDGLTDAFAIGWGAITSTGIAAMYLNNGDQTFSPFTNNPFVNARAGGCELADFNNDGFLDVLYCGYSDVAKSSVANLYFNQGGDGISANTPPTVPANLKAEVSGDQVTFTWDPSTDAETPSAGIHYNLYVQKAGEAPIFVLPADINTGFIKVAEQMNAINTNHYVMTLPNFSDYTWGVQAIDNGKMSSKFAIFGGTGINTVADNPIIISSSAGVLRVNTNGLTASVRITDVTGRTVVQTTSAGTYTNTELEKGEVYIVKVTTTAGEKTAKVVL